MKCSEMDKTVDPEDSCVVIGKRSKRGATSDYFDGVEFYEFLTQSQQLGGRRLNTFVLIQRQGLGERFPRRRWPSRSKSIAMAPLPLFPRSTWARFIAADRSHNRFLLQPPERGIAV
jgi:hypothetical protein